MFMDLFQNAFVLQFDPLACVNFDADSVGRVAPPLLCTLAAAIATYRQTLKGFQNDDRSRGGDVDNAVEKLSRTTPARRQNLRAVVLLLSYRSARVHDSSFRDPSRVA